jgi:ABC-type methionine transport system permease subunit
MAKKAATMTLKMATMALKAATMAKKAASMTLLVAMLPFWERVVPVSVAMVGLAVVERASERTAPGGLRGPGLRA